MPWPGREPNRLLRDLRVGDEIYAYDPSTRSLVPTEIVTIIAAKRECLALEFGSRQLRCTSTHPLYDTWGDEDTGPETD